MKLSLLNKFLGGVIIVEMLILIITAFDFTIQTVTIISTLLIAIATVIYVFFTYRLVKINSSALKEQLRPYVVASLPLRGEQIDLVVENIGKRPAYNVKISFTPELDKILFRAPKSAYEPLMSHKFLPPNFQAGNIISYGGYLTDNNLNDIIFDVKIKYEDTDGILYEEEYEIDIGSYIFENKFIQSYWKHDISGIKKDLDKINESLIKLTALREIELQNPPKEQ